MASKQKSAAESIRDTMDFLENIGAPFSDRSEEDWAEDPSRAEPETTNFKTGDRVAFKPGAPAYGKVVATFGEKQIRVEVEGAGPIEHAISALPKEPDGRFADDIFKDWINDQKISFTLPAVGFHGRYLFDGAPTESSDNQPPINEDAFDYRVGDKVGIGPNSIDNGVDGEIIGFEDGVEGRKWKINVFDNLDGILNELSRRYNNDGDQVVDGGKADIPSDIEILQRDPEANAGILLLPEKSTEGEDFASGSDTYFRKAKEPGATPSESIRASLNFLENIVNEYSTGPTPNPYHYGTKPQNKEKTVKPTGLIGDQTTTTSDNTDHYTKNGFFGGG